MNLKYLKPWEFSKILIIIYMKFIFKINQIKIKNIILLIIIYINNHTKLDFFSQHILIIYKLQKILNNHIIPLVINIILILNKYKINKYIYFNNFIKITIYIIIIINFFNNISIIKFYIMINKNIYFFLKLIDIFIYIIYWTFIFNIKIKFTKKKIIYIISIEILNKILLGNYIYFNNKEIYNIYKICGKTNLLTLIEDQQLSGIIIWILNSMMLLINIIKL